MMNKYLLKCEACREVLVRIDPSKLMTPINGSMFLPKKDNYPNPIRPEWAWADIVCPHCHRRPFSLSDVITTEAGMLHVPETPHSEYIESETDAEGRKHFRPIVKPDYDYSAKDEENKTEFKCPWCDKVYKSKKRLDNHIETHNMIDRKPKKMKAATI